MSTPQEVFEAIEQLRNNQKQLDMDGVTVGVSRQALDIVLGCFPAAPAPPAPFDLLKFAHRKWEES